MVNNNVKISLFEFSDIFKMIKVALFVIIYSCLHTKFVKMSVTRAMRGSWKLGWNLISCKGRTDMTLSENERPQYHLQLWVNIFFAWQTKWHTMRILLAFIQNLLNFVAESQLIQKIMIMRSFWDSCTCIKCEMFGLNGITLLEFCVVLP